MSSQVPPKLIPPSAGVFEGGALRIKLILRLMGDRRVSIFLKILPVFTLVYLFVPDLVVGPLDDAAVIWIGLTLFVELCPSEVVAEHIRALRAALESKWQPPKTDPPIREDEVIEGEFHDAAATGETRDDGSQD